MFFREIDAIIWGIDAIDPINSIVFYSLYGIYSIYPFVLSAYHLGGILPEAHFYLMGNESGDDEGDDGGDA